MPSAGLYKLYVYDKSGSLLYEMHGSKLTQSSSDEIQRYEFQKVGDETKCTYYFTFSAGESIEVNSSDLYHAKYPDIKIVDYYERQIRGVKSTSQPAPHWSSATPIIFGKRGGRVVFIASENAYTQRLRMKGVRRSGSHSTATSVLLNTVAVAW